MGVGLGEVRGQESGREGGLELNKLKNKRMQWGKIG